MRRRLRKKLRMAEFTEHGFDVQYELRPTVGEGAAQSFLDRFLMEAIEGHGLLCGGGCGPKAWDFFVVARGRATATDAQRLSVQEWLASQPDVAAHAVGALQNAWHDSTARPSKSTDGRHAA